MKDLIFKRKGRVISFGLACMLPILCYMATQYAIGLLFNSIERGEKREFMISMGIYLFLVVGGLAISFFATLIQKKFIRDVILDIREKAFGKILRKTYKEFSKKSKDIYISNLINDINTIEGSFFNSLMQVVLMGTVYIASTIIILYFDLKLGIGVILMSVSLFLISKSFGSKTVKLQEEVSRKNEEYTLQSANTFNGMEILKLNNMEETFLDKSKKSISIMEVAKFKYSFFTQGQRGFMEFIIGIFYMGVLAYLLNLVLNGRDIGTVVFIMNMALFSILPSGRSMPFLNELKAAGKIYHKITRVESDGKDEVRKEKPFKFQEAIEIRGLSYSYGDKEVIKDAEIFIEKGKKYLLRGASGAGKTTLMKLLSNVYDDYEGRIMLDGVDIKEVEEKSFNNNISYIYQDVFLFEDTIKNNVSLFKDIPNEKIMRAIEDAGLWEFIKDREDGIDEMLKENGKNLSGGQRQRISIARALAKESNILFVDEGTSGLDEELGAKIEETILSLDSTVVAISHRYYEGITEKYDYVIEIRDGKLKRYDSRQYFKEVYNSN